MLAGGKGKIKYKHNKQSIMWLCLKKKEKQTQGAGDAGEEGWRLRL